MDSVLLKNSGEPRSADLRAVDPVWARIREAAQAAAAAEPVLAGTLHATILSQPKFESALSYHLARLAGTTEVPAALILQTYRAAHWLWLQGRQSLAHFLQSRASALFGLDIHPGAVIGKGIFIDHGTGVVIGETAVVEDGVSMLHGVTLGGTGKERGDRHPKVRRGVLLGAGAKVLGNIEIGACAKIAAGSVVLEPVPAGCTAAGVPARIIGCVDVPEPALEMDQRI
jgi:serine O-acetyltransferase